MSAEVVAALVGVDSRLVSWEVGVHLEGSRHRPVGHDLLHDFLLSRDAVGRLGEHLVVAVGLGVLGVDASLRALGSGVLAVGAIGVFVSVDVVRASWEGVGVAGLSAVHVLVVASSGDAGAAEPPPGGSWLAPVAAH